MIEIVTASDDNYIQHLCVMLCSLLENTQYKREIKISIIDGGIFQENKDKLSGFILDRYNLKVNYLEIDKTAYQDFPISHHFTHTIYYRISIPLLFDNSIDKVLYLDADMIIKDDIKKIWISDISNSYVAAVEALSFNERYADLNMPEGSLYFCSGLLLMNLTKWREDNTMLKIIEFIEKNRDKIQMWDQDSLNSILCENWLPLPLKWNQQTYFFDDKIYQEFQNRQDFIDARVNPSVIHYTSSHKPWDYISMHPYKEEYFYYLKLTPWQDFKPKTSMWIYCKKILLTYTPASLLSFIRFLSLSRF
jgi:lipopolysaccharide biosynthesis glycosyltransferase